MTSPSASLVLMGTPLCNAVTLFLQLPMTLGKETNKCLLQGHFPLSSLSFCICQSPSYHMIWLSSVALLCFEAFSQSLLRVLSAPSASALSRRTVYSSGRGTEKLWSHTTVTSSDGSLEQVWDSQQHTKMFSTVDSVFR